MQIEKRESALRDAAEAAAKKRAVLSILSLSY